MAITPIQQFYRAVVCIDCDFDGSNPKTATANCNAAKDRMYHLEPEVVALATAHGVDVQSLNTQVLWQAAIQLESDDEQAVRSAVDAIEALVLKTEGASVLTD